LIPLIVCSKRHCQSGRDVRRDFNSGTMNFYLLNFLLSPSPQLRAAVDATVRAIRAPGPDCAAPQSFAIGIHMRWVAIGAQYLFEPQFSVFVAAAAALARGHACVSFYIASDDTERSERLQIELHRPALGWRVFTSPVMTATSDTDTFNSMLDMFTLAACDDLIVTQWSTFSSVASSLGLHRRVPWQRRSVAADGARLIVRALAHAAAVCRPIVVGAALDAERGDGRSRVLRARNFDHIYHRHSAKLFRWGQLPAAHLDRHVHTVDSPHPSPRTLLHPLAGISPAYSWR
jgi:hypothetical protein